MNKSFNYECFKCKKIVPSSFNDNLNDVGVMIQDPKNKTMYYFECFECHPKEV